MSSTDLRRFGADLGKMRSDSVLSPIYRVQEDGTLKLVAKADTLANRRKEALKKAAEKMKREEEARKKAEEKEKREEETRKNAEEKEKARKDKEQIKQEEEKRRKQEAEQRQQIMTVISVVFAVGFLLSRCCCDNRSSRKGAMTGDLEEGLVDLRQ